MVVTTSPNFSLYRIVVWEEIGASEGRGLALEKTEGVNFSEKRDQKYTRINGIGVFESTYLTSSIQTNHKDSHLLGAEHACGKN